MSSSNGTTTKCDVCKGELEKPKRVSNQIHRCKGCQKSFEIEGRLKRKDLSTHLLHVY